MASESTTSSLGTIKGPAIFLAQFMGQEAPFDTLENMAKWAASQGYKGQKANITATTLHRCVVRPG